MLEGLSWGEERGGERGVKWQKRRSDLVRSARDETLSSGAGIVQRVAVVSIECMWAAQRMRIIMCMLVPASGVVRLADMSSSCKYIQYNNKARVT